MTAQSDYEDYQALLVRLWDIDPEAAGYMADIANDMPDECDFSPRHSVMYSLWWRKCPQGRAFWERLDYLDSTLS